MALAIWLAMSFFAPIAYPLRYKKQRKRSNAKIAKDTQSSQSCVWLKHYTALIIN